jgi:HAD superfamily hydrolase (TIGR01549 family)
MTIKTLFIDAGGVIVEPNWQRVSDALAQHGVDVSAEALSGADPHARRQLDLGGPVNAAYNDHQRGWLYFNLILEQAGVTLSEATDRALADLQLYHSTANLWERVPSGVPEALVRLRDLGLQLVVVSNANGKLKLLLERVGLAAAFDLMLDSHEEGVEKPDPRLFHIALQRAGASAETTMHVGDLYHVDIEGARAAGLEATLLDPLNLYVDADCRRVRSLGQLADELATSNGAGA